MGDGGGRDRPDAWVTSGAMALTGWPDGAPRWPEGALPALLQGIVADIERRSARWGTPVTVDWPAALTGRAALLGLGRRGRTSANGTARLLRTGDGWVAVNLARPDDRAGVDALVGGAGADPWVSLEAWAAGRGAGAVVGPARLLGLPAAVLGRPDPTTRPTLTRARWAPTLPRPVAGLHLVDLSSMWAGPLCAQILQAAGAEVTKVESSTRPDGARATPAFFSWLHPPGQATVTLDFASPAGRRELAALIASADVVIEASRPRALEQLGVDADRVEDRRGRVWLSITGYGRDVPGRDWVAFGDDAAVAGGLVAWDEVGGPVFCGDAIADPLSGLVGAAAVLRALDAGGGRLIDLALSRVAAAAAAGPHWGTPRSGATAGRAGWEVAGPDGPVAVADPARPDGPPAVRC